MAQTWHIVNIQRTSAVQIYHHHLAGWLHFIYLVCWCWPRNVFMRLACFPLVLWPISINSFTLMAFSLHSVSWTPEGSGCRGREEVRASAGDRTRISLDEERASPACIRPTSIPMADHVHLPWNHFYSRMCLTMQVG